MSGSNIDVKAPMNEVCPISGKPIDPEATLLHEGKIIGFCSKEHRDQFQTANNNLAEASPGPGGDTA